MNSRQDIRQAMRQQRRRLDPRKQHRHARRLAAHLARSAVFRKARHIAAYWAADGEPDLAPLMRLAAIRGKRLYLPVVAERGVMRFYPYHPEHSRLRRNRYGIPEPRLGGRPLPAHRLDLVLAPLVAFDDRGNRLGMGGGYYDRCFAFTRHRRRWQHPRLLGVAHAFQRVPALAGEPWDVPLWGIITERGLRAFQ
ncbi:5-formyltetrahydrofolate cyclo-ligase [Alkalilimnicola sp. S0819]|uniref:5-formyltetrahydrofolate cyclo-ligase n=1 Tax=Alkalilimnicola sp. S0819 TaxID=2613922 RepID=UPI0012624869|nr:5-formyltetrahydrofolate cyclo-ligase [Alkalilimnicola sp. S0819]KAB7628205.1 5-formyltetrahydrofolate cyclo-ligase [Alkalilimnicola sp. S0819]MPQ15096.1 5-formyltetrahydrofolate cyclo-ligase [Alkalilimnicola sp. S0819]